MDIRWKFSEFSLLLLLLFLLFVHNINVRVHITYKRNDMPAELETTKCVYLFYRQKKKKMDAGKKKNWHTLYEHSLI